VQPMDYQPASHTFDCPNAISGFFTIALQFTRSCNYKCIHCSERDYLPCVPTDEMLQIVNRLADYGVKRVNVSGGEPTLRHDWIQIIQHMAKRGLNVSLATNCSNLTDEALTELKGAVSNIRISLYGDARTHDFVTQHRGSFSIAKFSVKKAIENGIPVYACMALMQTNLAQINAVRNICREWGIEKLLIYSLVPKGRGQDIFDEESVAAENVAALVGPPGTLPEVYWHPFDKPGICALIQADGSLVATPYFDSPEGVKVVGCAYKEPLSELWAKYPFKENYLEFNGAKLKCATAS